MPLIFNKYKNIKYYLIFMTFSFKSFGQQNLFNIPSGDITLKNKIFYQHQLNFYQNNFDTKSHLVYGIGKNYDIGLNFISKKNTINPLRFSSNDNNTSGSLNPLVVFTIQKKIELYKEKLHLNIGTQLGSNLSKNVENFQFSNFNYVFLLFHLNPKSRLVGGSYYSNKNYQGTNDYKLGTLAGFELNIYRKWYLMGDWISGKNDIGETVLGGMYILNKRVQLCSGVLLPNQSHKIGLVLEVNILGWDYN